MASKFFPSFLDELQARVEIEDTIKRFVRGVDRQDWDLARATYHADAVDEHGFFTGKRDAFIDFIAQIHKTQEHSMHVISNVLIDFTARDKAVVETYCLVFQRFGASVEGVKPGSHGIRRFATSRYIDKFEARNGDWRVAHRTLVFSEMQTEQVTEPVVFPPNFVVQRHDMDDVLYKIRTAAQG